MSFGSITAYLETPKLLAESPCLPKWEADAQKRHGKAGNMVQNIQGISETGT